MDFLIATTTYVYNNQGKNALVESAHTVLALTDKALDLINFFSQFLTLSFGIVFGLLAVIILLLIYRP